MLTGWLPSFTKNRYLTDQEERDHLLPNVAQKVIPEDGVGLINFNSICMDFVDRSFKIKGMSATLAFSLFSVFAVGLYIYFGYLFIKYYSGESIGEIIFINLLQAGFLLFPFVFWKIFLKNDFFSYVFHPIRFNRKTGKIHVFRHNGPGGVLTVPWGDPSLHFHIGHGTQNKDLRDLRCHVLDADRWVIDTFVVGHSTDEDLRIREQWEFIRRYMEQGPDHVVDDPLDGVITLSVKPSWKNCYLWVCFALGQGLFPLRRALFPIYGLLTLSRWLTFKTCKAPVWPANIQAEGAMEPGDPYHWPEPEYMAAFAENNAVYERAVRRNELRKGQHRIGP